MPELPEVECVRRMIEPLLVGRRIAQAQLRRRDVVVTPDDPPGGFSRSGRDSAVARAVEPDELLVGGVVRGVLRHGKAMAVLDHVGRNVVIHLGMTGLVHPLEDEPTRHTHLIWLLDDGRRVAFSDPRRFGGIWCLADRAALDARWAALGPDALGVEADHLADRLRSSIRPIKAALLDQEVLAGVGNIYADEALFRAGIRPLRHCATLRAAEWQRLAGAIREVLQAGLEAGGASIRDYRRPDGSAGSQQERLLVYGRLGQPCTACRTPLRGDRLGGRATVWCPRCQPARPLAERRAGGERDGGSSPV